MDQFLNFYEKNVKDLKKTKPEVVLAMQLINSFGLFFWFCLFNGISTFLLFNGISTLLFNARSSLLEEQ